MKKSYRVYLLCILLCAGTLPSGRVWAQDFQFLGFYDYYGGIEAKEGYENLRSRLYMRPRFSGYNESLNYQWVLSSALWVQPVGEAYAIDSWDILQEAFVLFPFEKFDVTVGQKVAAFGFADIYGPLNVVGASGRNLLSLDDPYDSRRPDPLVQLRLYPSFEDIIGITYVPLSRRDLERPGPVELPESGDTIVWSEDPYILENPHSIFLHYSRYGHLADIQLLYGWYTDHSPDFEVEETEKAVSSEIETVYRKKHTFGAAYSRRVRNSTLSQDFGFTLTEDFDGGDIGAQNADITVNTQLLTNLPGGVLAQFSFVYSYFFKHGEHESGVDPDAADYLAAELQSFHTQPLQHIAFAVGHFERTFFREKLKAQLNVGFFFSPDIYLAPRLAYSLSDYWSFETGADITLGDPPDEDLRRNPRNDNYYLRLTYRY